MVYWSVKDIFTVWQLLLLQITVVSRS